MACHIVRVDPAHASRVHLRLATLTAELDAITVCVMFCALLIAVVLYTSRCHEMMFKIPFVATGLEVAELQIAGATPFMTTISCISGLLAVQFASCVADGRSRARFSVWS